MSVHVLNSSMWIHACGLDPMPMFVVLQCAMFHCEMGLIRVQCRP